MGEADAAEKLFDSAISKDPDQLTAWQGKAKLCEQVMDKAASSTGETRAKLSACYGKLATHHLEKVQRAASYSVKACELYYRYKVRLKRLFHKNQSITFKQGMSSQ